MRMSEIEKDRFEEMGKQIKENNKQIATKKELLEEQYANEKYKLQDVDLIIKKVGVLSDFCGSWCGSSGKSLFTIYLNMLTQYWYFGVNDETTSEEFRKIVRNDKELSAIYKRWELGDYADEKV